MIAAPEAWAVVDGRKPPRRPMDVVVHLPGGQRVAYRRDFRASMDAIGQALEVYPDAARVSVTPVPLEARR